MIAWLDVETTGYDENTEKLLEVAFVLTDDTLVERASTSVVIKPEGFEQHAMPIAVREMHEKSGLLVDIEKFGIPLEVAEQRLVDWLSVVFVQPEDVRAVPIAGFTVEKFDRTWLRKWMWRLEKMFSHQSIDVSTVTLLARRWAPEIYAGRPKAGADSKHRAIDDIYSSIEYLKYYLSSGFIKSSKGAE